MLSFYGDESGSMGRGQGDWVALLAIGFRDDHWKPIKEAVDALKRSYFPNWNLDEVELKSVYLRRWNQPDQHWPPNAFTTLNAIQIAQFGRDLYTVIDGAPFEWAAVAFSKAHLLHRYGIAKPRDVFSECTCICSSDSTVGRTERAVTADFSLTNNTRVS